MFLLSPQYWLFEALALFLITCFVFWILSGTGTGRRFLGIIFRWNDPKTVVADAAEVKQRAEKALPQAAANLRQQKMVLDDLHQATGEQPPRGEGVS